MQLTILILTIALAQTGGITFAPGAGAATTPRNLDFEIGDPDKPPPDWSLAQDSRIAGYSAELRKSECHAGSGCAAIVAGPKAEQGWAGTLVQRFDATPYREKTMRLRAWMKVESARRGDRIRVFITVDGEKKSAEFVQKGAGVREGEWTLGEVEGKIGKDATEVSIGVTVSGKRTAWVDDVTFEAVPAGK